MLQSVRYASMRVDESAARPGKNKDREREGVVRCVDAKKAGVVSPRWEKRSIGGRKERERVFRAAAAVGQRAAAFPGPYKPRPLAQQARHRYDPLADQETTRVQEQGHAANMPPKQSSKVSRQGSGCAARRCGKTNQCISPVVAAQTTTALRVVPHAKANVLPALFNSDTVDECWAC